MDGRNRQGSQPAKVTSHTFFSLHIIILMIGLAIWITRLADKVEEHDRLINDEKRMHEDCSESKKRLNRLENVIHYLHPKLPGTERE